jgi:hypothetical protein
MASVELYSEVNAPQVLPFPCHATDGTFSAGDLVQIATNGKVQIATAGSISGIARTAYGAENKVINVELIDPANVYSARYKASATSQSLVGDCLDFTFTVGGHTLDESDAATDVYCVGLDPRDGAATSGRLLIRFYGTLLTADAT